MAIELGHLAGGAPGISFASPTHSPRDGVVADDVGLGLCSRARKMIVLWLAAYLHIDVNVLALILDMMALRPEMLFCLFVGASKAGLHAHVIAGVLAAGEAALQRPVVFSRHWEYLARVA
ncbi:MAG: hypothetical protein ACRERX_10960 [Pseudomonas sp.]